MQSDEQTLTFTPIGVVRSGMAQRADAPRQGSAGGGEARIELNPGRNLEQAVDGLEGFDRIWVLFVFDRNSGWRPKVQPPRGPARRIGCLATRAPHRPNPIGLSCVRLLGVSGRTVHIADADLLDGTPVLDLKPYLPYADAFPSSRAGWTEHIDTRATGVSFSDTAARQVLWLEQHGLPGLRLRIVRQLQHRPLDAASKRIRTVGEGRAELAVRTWRILLTITADESAAHVLSVRSGFSPSELDCSEDPFRDAALHRAFHSAFPIDTIAEKGLS
jgi:tRNA (adenine37-N6)-methyltransferase